VTHRATSRFWRCYKGLPRDVQRSADRGYALLKTNPNHPSLHFKKVGQFWSVAVDAGEDLVWFWIGSHADYDKLLGQKPANKAPQPTRRGARRQKPTRSKPRG
jgi:hypothetical protein